MDDTLFVFLQCRLTFVDAVPVQGRALRKDLGEAFFFSLPVQPSD
jgi:hypothetical protein